MTISRGILMILLAFAASVSGQTVPAGSPVRTTQPYGAVTVQGARIKSGPNFSLARKRFYLFSGGFKENAALIERIKAAEITSRDCYYTGINASACLIDWLAQENCETPFCRKIEQADIARVSEFDAAYKKGLPLYGRKPAIALDWVINNLPSNIAIGFYQQQRSKITQILGGVRPIESAMTTAKAPTAVFANIPIADKNTTILMSNVLPVEVGNKSFVWICEVTVPPTNKAVPVLLTTDPAKKTNSFNCTAQIRDIKVCSAGACEKK
jgi:hypothetical protein